MQASKYVLRDLPGVAELRARLEKIAAHPNPLWAPEVDDLPAHADRVSLGLVGLELDDTSFNSMPNAHQAWEDDTWDDEWEAHETKLAGLWLDDPEAILAAWGAIGWDVADEHGDPLSVLQHIGRQLVCATLGLAGRLPDAPASDAEINVRAEEWGGDFAAQARRFQQSRRLG